jgi:endonuclease/exonuclease/phosphatase (EEP) superfamily protein YafD
LRFAAALLWLAGCVRVPEAPVTVSAGSAALAELPQSFALVCWNVHKERSRRLAAELERLGSQADLVLLQEAVRPPRFASQSWTMVEAFRFVNGGAPAGVATGTVAAPTQQWPLYSPVREPLANSPKSALATAVPLHGGHSLLVVNVHGVNFRCADALRDQLATLDPIVAAHDGPVIVAGDFNTWSRRRAAVVQAFAERHRLQRVFTGRGAPRLDAVFQRGLGVEHAEVLRTRSSDHAVLTVRFAVLARAAEER